MIMLFRTLDVQPGKMKEATAWAAKMLAYYKEFAPGQRSFVRNITGNLHQLHYVSYFESLAVLEETKNKARANQDPKHQELMAERETIFFIATATDSLYETLD